MMHDENIRFTQNFLRDAALVDKIVKLAAIQPGSTVLEIGPGKGIITRSLATQVTPAGKVIAVELDPNLAANLKQQFADMPQIEIVNQDIQQYRLADLPADYTVFANPPFNITSMLLERLFDPHHAPLSACLILQKEAIWGTNHQGLKTETLKSLVIAPFFEIRLLHTFAKTDFSPQPAVATALFGFERRATPLINGSQYERYKDFIALVARDRVGEGVWRKLFSKKQLHSLTTQSGLVDGRGLKSQSMAALIAAFQVFLSSDADKLVAGSMRKLRHAQKRSDQINRAGNHHRSKKRKQDNAR